MCVCPAFHSAENCQCVTCHECVYQRLWYYTFDAWGSYNNPECFNCFFYWISVSVFYVFPFLYVLIFYPTLYFIPSHRVSYELCTRSRDFVFYMTISTCYCLAQGPISKIISVLGLYISTLYSSFRLFMCRHNSNNTCCSYLQFEAKHASTVTLKSENCLAGIGMMILSGH